MKNESALCVYIDHFLALYDIKDNKIVFDLNNDISVSKTTLLLTEDQKIKLEVK